MNYVARSYSSSVATCAVLTLAYFAGAGFAVADRVFRALRQARCIRGNLLCRTARTVCAVGRESRRSRPAAAVGALAVVTRARLAITIRAFAVFAVTILAARGVIFSDG